MNTFGKLLALAAIAALTGCAAAGRSALPTMTDRAVDVVGACEQAVYYPTDGEGEQMSLACADVLDVWR